MKSIQLFLVLLLFTYSSALSQQPLKHEIHSRGMIRQSVYNDGGLGRPLDNGKGGSFQNEPSFEWPSNGGYPFYIGQLSYKGFYNSMGAGLWIAGDTAQFSGSGVTPRVYSASNVTDASGTNQPSDAIRGDVVRTENYPILANGQINPAYNPDEAEEKIVSTWDTPLGISVTRTSRAWSHPDYDDFIIYECELENTGNNAVTGRLDTIRAITVGLAYTFDPSMIAGMLKNSNNWADIAFRGDKVGAKSFNYGRYNWTRWLLYNHTIDGVPYLPQGATDTILTAPGAVGVLPLYYDYSHLANKDQCIVAFYSSSPVTDTVFLYDSNRKLKQPYCIKFDNGNLNLAKFQISFNLEASRSVAPVRTSSDSATFGNYWLGRSRAQWSNSLRNPTGKFYVFGPYILAPHEKMKLVYAEVAGFGAGVASDSIYWDMGGGWGSGDHAPSDEPVPGVHPIPSWWNTMTYPNLTPPSTGYTHMGSTYMQTHRLPDYVNSNVISIRDVADRAIQMWKGGSIIKYDDTSRYMNTFIRDASKQFDPTPAPLGSALPTGNFQVPMQCPAPAIFVDNTAAASNKIIWGTQVDSMSRSTPGFSRLTSPLSYYLVLRANDLVGPWQVLDTVQRHDSRYFISSASVKNKGVLNLTDSIYAYVDGLSDINKDYFYAVVSVDSLGLKSGRTNAIVHNTQAPAVKKLGHVYAAPNPFIIISGDNSSSGSGGLASNKIGFFGLPKRATIRIFSYSGQLVRTLDHESVDPVTSPEGKYASTWFQVSRNDQWVSSGVYFFVVEDKDTGDRAWNKFVIIH